MMMRTRLLLLAFLIACGPGPRHNGGDDDGTDASCANGCSADGHAVVDCHGGVVQACDGGDACDTSTYTCQNACVAAENNHRSVGCDYYATDMETLTPGYCFAMFVANTWTSPAHINVEYKGQQLNVA